MTERIGKYVWISEALRCIESSTFDEGDTPFHKASQMGNLEMLHYLVEIIKEREGIQNSNIKKLLDILEFTNNENKTPMFLAA